MPGLLNTTNREHLKRSDASYHARSNPSCQSPTSSTNSTNTPFDDDEDDEYTSSSKRQECAMKVAAWINQSAVRITAMSFQAPSSFDMLDFDLESDLDFDLDLESEDEEEPYIIYSTPVKSAPPVIHAPAPRRPSSFACPLSPSAFSAQRPSRSRSHRHHGHGRSHGRNNGYRPRTPSPLGLYVIEEGEEDAE